MSNPTFPNMSGAAADALGGTTDVDTGIKHLHPDANQDTTPTHAQRVFEQAARMLELLGRYGGATIHLTGRRVGVFACEYEIGAVERRFAGEDDIELDASETNHLYLDADETLKISDSGWPGGAHFRLAKVITNGSTVTEIIDVRMQNFQRGGNAWHSVTAAGDVDLGNFLVKNLAGAVLKAPTELTLASDTVTPTQEWHTVDTQSNAASDDLVTLTPDAAKIGRKVLLRCETAARVVTVKSTGNIKLLDPDCVLDDTGKFIELIQDTATTWAELGRNVNSPQKLLFPLDANQKSIKQVGVLGLHFVNTPIVAGEVSPAGNTLLHLVPESGNVDEVTEIGLGEGEIAIVTPEFIQTITLRHGVGNIVMAVARDHTMDLYDYVAFIGRNSQAVEIWRARWRLNQLIGTGNVLPYSPAMFKAGTIANNTVLLDVVLSFPLTLRSARGRVGTAPSGGSCVVHVKKNGASVFAADANAINIAAGTQTDVSDTVNASFAVGDRLTVEATLGNSAADLGVTIEAYQTTTEQP
jgi:hypothetical protein